MADILTCVTGIPDGPVVAAVYFDPDTCDLVITVVDPIFVEADIASIQVTGSGAATNVFVVSPDFVVVSPTEIRIQITFLNGMLFVSGVFVHGLIDEIADSGPVDFPVFPCD